MAEPITIPDLENGKIDIDTLADIVNLQEETTVTRLSGPVKTWYGVMQDLAVSGGLAYETLEELQAITGTQGQVAEVTNDGDNTGRYSWQDGAWVKSLDTTSEKIEAGYAEINANKFPPGFFDYQDAVADDTESGNLLWAVRTSDGRIVGELATQGQNVGDPLLDAEYAEVEVDDTPEMNIIRGVRWDGTTTSDTSGDALDLYVKISPQGRQQVKLFQDGSEISIGSAFESYGPVDKGTSIEYKEQATVAVYKRFKEYPFSEVPSGVTNITHVIGYGESLAAGTGSDPALTTPLIPNQVFMVNAGVLSLGREQDASAKDVVINDAGLQFIVPAFSQIRESPILSAAYRYAINHPTEFVVVTQHGIGGAVIADMVRGNEAYDNLVHTSSQVKSIAETNGLAYKISPISYIQGTNDWNATPTYYGGMLDTLWSQLNEDLKAVTNQSNDIVLIIDQTLAGGGQNDMNLAFTQIDKALTEPTKFRISNPRYGVPYVDSAHFDAVGYVNAGDSQGRAMEPSYMPLYPVSAVRSGTTVTVVFSEGGLVLDTTSIQNYADGNFGFFWKDDSDSAVISGVTLLDDTITITLSATPTGANPQIRIADRASEGGSNQAGTGKRCCLRTASLGNDSLGNPVYKRAAIYKINVTE